MYLGSLMTSLHDLLIIFILFLEHFDWNHHRYRSWTTAPSHKTSPYQTHSDKIILYRIFQRNNFKLLPPPAFGHGVATFDFFLYFNLPSSQICTILPTSFVTAPSQISLPLNLQLALMVVARKNRVMARVTSYVTNINFLKLQTKLYPNYKMWRWLFHSIYELLHLFQIL